jgi:hypothetical protein
MRVGQERAARVLFGIGLVALALDPVAASEPPSTVAPTRTLHVLLTAAPELPATSRSRLMSEASDVWSRAGVELIWTDGSDGSVPPQRMLRVLVIPRRSGVQESPERHVLGELLGYGRPGALAVASINRAQQMLTAWRGFSIGPQSLHDGQLGLVLGRVIAHEIGHYLLGTATHSRKGLMRATFESPDLMDHRSPSYDLDADALARLKQSSAR